MTETKEGFAQWVILELMGHRKLAGYLTEQEIGGGAFLRLDIPARRRGSLLHAIPLPRIPGLHEGCGQGLAVLEGRLLSWKGLLGADTLRLDTVAVVDFQEQARTECGVSEGVNAELDDECWCCHLISLFVRAVR